MCSERDCLRFREYYQLNKEIEKERSKQYRKDHPDKVKQSHRKYYLATYKKTLQIKFGIDYDEILKEQSECCAICGLHFSEYKKALSVDHDHKTGETRGLLCNNCNVGLGNFKDDVSILRKAILYLQAYEKQNPLGNEFIKEKNI